MSFLSLSLYWIILTNCRLQVCSDIYAENIDVLSPSGTNEFVCTNVGFQLSL
jgi:hypothetical protein